MGVTPYRMDRGLVALCAVAMVFVGHAAADNGQTGSEAKLEAARTAPCSTAVRIYLELSADSTVADSIRAISSERRADIAFALREYETAADYYKKAAAFEKGHDRYYYRCAIAARANGDTAAALATLSPIIDSGKIPYRYEAAVLKGELLIARKDYAGAMVCFQKTGPFSLPNGWSVHALLGKLECARRLGLADSAAVFDKKLANYRQTMLEKERLRKIREIPLAKPAAVADSGAMTTAAPRDTAAPDSTFALQVGAFGSKANAQALVQKLKPKYKEVSCVPAVVEERTFYRVWVGNFETREAAERFGKEKLTRQGFVYRLVVK